MHSFYKKFIKWLERAIWIVCILVVCVVGVLLLSARFSIPGGYRLYAVLTGSMSPEIPVGSLVITRVPSRDIHVGSIITFEESDSKRLITHRVVENKEGQILYTKGDANQTADLQPVLKNNIRGVYATHLPYVGKILEFIKSPLGLILSIGLPAVLVIIQELRAVVRVLVDRKMKGLPRFSRSDVLPFIDSIHSPEMVPVERRPHKIRVTMFAVGAIVLGLPLLSSTSYANFMAEPVSILNSTLSTAIVFTSPTPSVSPLPSITPSPTSTPTATPQPGNCDTDISVEQNNTNTGPGSVNQNSATIQTNCDRHIKNTTQTSTTIHISVD